jgi:hypothetical protein
MWCRIVCRDSGGNGDCRFERKKSDIFSIVYICILGL